jgi:hypothetical protein
MIHMGLWIRLPLVMNPLSQGSNHFDFAFGIDVVAFHAIPDSDSGYTGDFCRLRWIASAFLEGIQQPLLFNFF